MLRYDDHAAHVRAFLSQVVQALLWSAVGPSGNSKMHLKLVLTRFCHMAFPEIS